MYLEIRVVKKIGPVQEMTECVRGSVKMFETDKVAEKHSENSSSVDV